jgi:threonine aldolase
MRFMAAQWVGMLRNGAWLKRARHANTMAARLETSLRESAHVSSLFPRQANSVFVPLSEQVIESLRAYGWKFYTFIGQGGCRLMCSWDTTEQDVQQLARRPATLQ